MDLRGAVEFSASVRRRKMPELSVPRELGSSDASEGLLFDADVGVSFCVVRSVFETARRSLLSKAALYHKVYQYDVCGTRASDSSRLRCAA